MAQTVIPLTCEQRKWIILKYGELKNLTEVRRAFRKHFFPKHPRKVPKICLFRRVVEKFSIRGTIHEIKREAKPVDPNDIERVKLFFECNKKAHIRDAVRDLDISFGKIWFILRKCLKWKCYTPHKTTILSRQHKETRLKSADWFLSHDVSFFEENILWSDEKYYVLKQGPNKSIDRYWSPVNKFEYEECRSQGQQKAMCWVGLLNGKVIGPVWIEGNMDQFVYRDILEEQIWPKVRNIASRKQVYFMQDGAKPHTTQMNLDYLKDKFQGRLISNKTAIIWPPNSPDLNPLDFWFWGYSMSYVHRYQLSSLSELKSIVNEFAKEVDQDMVKRACGSARGRFEKMKAANGSHFEHIYK